MNLLFIILSPLLGAILLGLMYLFQTRGVNIKRNFYTFIALITPLISFIFSILCALRLHESQERFIYDAYTWLKVGDFTAKMSFLGDNLSIFMAVFITFVAWLIHIYASGYMRDDYSYGKFFFYFNLFLASMLLLVLANSPIVMFIGWEGVGVCSYFLISFYYRESPNVLAGNKAFIVNRVGDIGFLVGLCTLFFALGGGGFDYQYISANINNISMELKIFIGVALFIGAMAKSAQIPLYVWLPDAMAGPTPVSALIHAATMVTAGIYMVSRFFFLYNEIPQVGLFIAYVGAFSSLFAAIIAIKQSDIKKILAYSTMSQLGYMFVAVGLENYSAGLFHVFTHAFFKALLFMSAGAVIVALHHEQNIFKMGNLKKELPIVYYVSLVGCLAIAGIPPFSGFFSKDEILFGAFARGEYIIWGLEVITAMLTAFYMFRMFFVAFCGKNAEREKIHFVPQVMIIPLIILAFGASVVGFLGVPHVLGGSNIIHSIVNIKSFKLPHVSSSIELSLMALNIFVGIVGIFIAKKMYYQKDLSTVKSPTGIIANKFYIDEIYQFVFVETIKKLSDFIAKVSDKLIIDAFIKAICLGLIKFGEDASVLQNANLRAYTLMILVGISAFSIYLLNMIG